MPWRNDTPRSTRYGREHRAERARLLAELARVGVGRCAERVCVMRSRTLTPGMAIHLAHDPTGTVVIGLAHARCNLHEAAVRGNRIAARRRRHRQPTPRAQRARTDRSW